MKKLSKLTKLLLPSVSFLLVAIMSLTGATYAWFQTGTDATVEQMQANVIEAEGLRVSWDAEHWSSSISANDDYYKYKDDDGNYTNNTIVGTGSDFKFSPVSTSGVYANGRLKMFGATIKKTSSGTTIQTIYDAMGNDASGTTKANRGYIMYDIYFDLKEASKVNVSDIVVSTGSTIGLASRVAFMYHGHAENAADAKPLNQSTYTYGDDLFIYEPNEKLHTQAGKDLAGDNRDIKFDYLGIKDLTTNTGLNLDMDDATSQYLGEIGSSTTHEGTYTETTGASPETGIQFDWAKGYHKLTVYIWVEGQDVDCNEDLAGSGFTVDIKFDKVVTAG